ncbi:MAG: hypothetical protein WDM88_05845 [Galbitalea sp.]
MTTITTPIEQAGRVAVTLLLGSIESRPGGGRDGVLLPTHLTVRGSTGPLSATDPEAQRPATQQLATQ